LVALVVLLLMLDAGASFVNAYVVLSSSVLLVVP
jgi:hypothetical protein